MIPERWTLDELLAWWCGPPARQGRRPAVSLPDPLLDFYRSLDG